MVAVRNARYLADNETIDCEAEHPDFGWIDFTATESDTSEFGQEVWAALQSTTVEAYTAPSEAERRAAWRETAYLAKDQFILACFDAGILTQLEAEQAIYGWPTTWADFFIGQTARQQLEAKALWARVTNVYRAAPLVSALQAHASLTDGQIDALFGYIAAPG